MKRPILLFITAILISGCATYRAYYDINLLSVERPAEAEKRYGEQIISKFEDKGTEKYCFEDNSVKIKWLPSPFDFAFELTNKTGYTIRIIWDDAAFVDTDGMSHRVIHSGVAYSNVGVSMAPTAVAKQGTVSDFVFPSDYIFWNGWNWVRNAIFPAVADTNYIGQTRWSLERDSKPFIGQTVKIILPIQIQDITNDYVFAFKINNVEVK